MLCWGSTALRKQCRAMPQAFAHHDSVRAHKPYCCRKGIVAPGTTWRVFRSASSFSCFLHAKGLSCGSRKDVVSAPWLQRNSKPPASCSSVCGSAAKVAHVIARVGAQCKPSWANCQSSVDCPARLCQCSVLASTARQRGQVHVAGRLILRD